MIKKLLIALVALSFLVGNFAFADNNPPGVKDYDAVPISSGEVMYPELLPLAPLKPAAEDCGTQDYTCSDPALVYLSGGAATFTDMCMRFSPTTIEACHLDEVAFYVYDLTGFGFPALAGDLVVTIYAEDPLYDNYPWDDGNPAGVLHQVTIPNAQVQFYPNINYVTMPTGGIPFQGEDIFAAVGTALSSDYMGAMGEDNLVCCGGTCASEFTERGSAYYPAYGYHVFLSNSGCGDCPDGDMINYCIYAYICCEEPLYTCPGNQEWPTFQQNYARTGYTTNTIGDLTNFRKLWEYQDDYYLVWGHPIIANEMVFVAFYDGIVALNLYTGLPIWRSIDHSDYAAFMHSLSNNLRSTPTVEGDNIYFGTGKATLTEGFVCADKHTGDTIWVRHANTGWPLDGGFSGLTGEMQYTTSVIIGDNIYFGNSFGVFYCLNKFTGTTVWFGQLDQGVWYSPTTDGTDIFVGTSDGYLAAMPAVGGTVYKLAGAGDGSGGMSVLYTWNGYDAAYEGFVTAPVYNVDENAIYVNGNLGVGVGTSSYYEGLLMKLSAVDLTPIFGSWFLTMNPYFVTPNLMPFPWERLTCGGAHSLYWFFTSTASLSALRQFTLAGSLAWYGSDQEMYFPSGGGPYWGNQSCSFASTCDPYLFVGSNIQGVWYIKEGLTGTNILKYQFTDEIMGTATAEYDDHDYVITTQFASACGNGWGKVYCFDVGGPRPRLYIPSSIVTLPSVSFVDPYPQSRFAEIIGNVGSADLNYTLEIVTAKAGVKGKPFAKLASELRADMLNETMSLLDTRSLAPSMEKGSDSYNTSLLAEFVRFPGASTTTSGTLGPGTLLNQEFVLDPELMFRGANPFDVEVSSDDPDYLECDAKGPQATVTVIAVKGYDFCDGYINFGVAGNTAYVNNGGWNSEAGPSDAFVIDGYTDFMFHGSFFYGYEDDHMIWLEEVGNAYNHFEPNSLCLQDTVTFDMSTGSGYFSVDADRFQASFIDSLKDQATGEFDNSNTPGCEMFIKEYGGFDAAFHHFKYVYVEITNRGNDPLPAPLYWGYYTDWDVADYGANIGVGMVEDGASAYRMYDGGDPAFQYGIGSVPMLGNLFAGTLAPTMGAYGTFQIANDPVVYDGIIIDSFFNYIDDCPAYSDCYYPGTEVGVNPGQDMTATITADKRSLAGGETIKGGLVFFGFTGTKAGPAEDITELMCFANKFAGWGRGDVNNDCVIDLVDLCLLNAYVNCQGQEPYPFLYLGDIDGNPGVDNGDVDYLFDYLFNGGPLPIGDWVVR
jgi:hypothetical protein